MNYKKYWDNGISYQEYKQNIINELEGNSDSKYLKYLPLNIQRLNRIEKTVSLNPELLDAIAGLTPGSHLLVISEGWCGDAAQILPVLNALAIASEGRISLRIVYRDQNQELMNAHLTGTSQSIPVVILLNDNLEFQSWWGPRPKVAQELLMKLKSDPATANEYQEPLHNWYHKDKQQAIQHELQEFLMLDHSVNQG